MERFYRGLAGGEEKVGALQHAMLSLLRPDDGGRDLFQHPYFWAPFFLVGDGGPI
jgi:CHAT domain-containing protein